MGAFPYTFIPLSDLLRVLPGSVGMTWGIPETGGRFLTRDTPLTVSMTPPLFLAAGMQHPAFPEIAETGFRVGEEVF